MCMYVCARVGLCACARVTLDVCMCARTHAACTKNIKNLREYYTFWLPNRNVEHANVWHDT